MGVPVPPRQGHRNAHHRRDPADGEAPVERDENSPSSLDLETTGSRFAAAILVTCARHHRATL
ncbi:hypothetical protein GCM10023205_77110 [Yinghuangia aomiensis]|uniref:Uncharacterized protein n=1 Tax=Yinghuangia aomiensis TaxID=676205 RepID=A0ABP9IA70_9ACTN